MARKPTAASGHGHNSGDLTDDDIAALTHFYAVKIRKQQKTAAEAKAKYDSERTEVNGLFSIVKGDLKYSRKEFEELLAAQDLTENEFLLAEAKRAKRFSLAGLPVGTQLDMFGGKGPDTVDDKAAAELDGYRAGRRADDRDPPERIAAILHPDWLAGWDRGQDDNGRDFIRANEIIEARKAADGPQLETAPETEDADEDEHPDDVIEDAAEALQAAGWTKPTEAETAFEEVAA